ncbi:MET10 [Candida pseudojiufengensis]|uniref:MET10 n=1 Tax=Candida pseudojiufengensis TaxID=497109 RepID=UPI00222564EA|nr:MET10 [Candida pseudojiufengensis]KAI5961035.1 MET10 [Candida pseudojiufengensis]
MAPHALQNGSSSPNKNGENLGSVGSKVTNLLNSNPFGITTDPNSIKGNSYISATTIINQSIYSIASKIFSYETIGIENLLDSYIQLWLHNQQPNAFDIVPFYNKFEVRSGASNAILGYFKKNGTNGQPVSAIVGANGIDYMRNSLYGQKAPLSLNVSAVDFVDDSLVSNYGRVLNVARDLNFPVFTPLNFGNEIQHLTILNHFFAFLSGKPSIFLFDGLEFAKNFRKFENLLSVKEIGQLYQDLLDSASNSDATIDKAFELLNKITGKNYSQFEYLGNKDAKTVFVVYGTFASEQWGNLVNDEFGLIQIRVPVPFNQDKFLSIIPESTEKLVVLSTQNDQLKADISASLFLGNRYHSLTIEEFKYPHDFTWSPITIAKSVAKFDGDVNVDKLLSKFEVNNDKDEILNANTSPEGKYLFWGRDNSLIVDTADKLALSLSLDDRKKISIRNKFDNSKSGGVFQSQIISTTGDFVSVDAADVVLIEDLSLLNSYDFLATLKPKGKVILVNSKQQIDTEKFPIEFKRSLAINHNKLSVVDLTVVEALDETNNGTKGLTAELLLQLAFWRATLPELGGYIVNKLLQANGGSFELLATVLDNFIKAADQKHAIVEVEVSPEWENLSEKTEDTENKESNGTAKDEKTEEDKPKEQSEEEPAEEFEPLPFFIKENSLIANPRIPIDKSEVVNHSSYHNIAQKITFPDTFNIKKELRPDLPVKNFVVKVQENKRLTPTEYSRNIFHIEFDITGTGLKYELGEALGIHGRNNSEEVEKFIKFYNLDGDSLIEMTNKEDFKFNEIRTVRQILSESIDFLGKPPKRFYESLAEFATDSKQKEQLTKLGSSEGAEELKKRQDTEFDSYFDILEEFTSARPAFNELVKIIAPLKRREYSIASSQKLHPNSVHLLIVVVDWIDPKGRLRYGHCSKYLSDLKIGDELVVSVKPSVMKLPPSPKQPIIMSGLGTGLAPFKAFLEEKIWQKQQGMEIGEIYLFMGSRHKKEEYLYGELWEAYKDAGILTHIGAAFSRDQVQKIYIQDKIKESIEELTDAFVNKKGGFYLCGPTWPVPDITQCLSDIIINGAKKQGEEISDVGKLIEDLKEEGRYILEVY